MNAPAPIPVKEWKNIIRRIGELYKKLKASEITLVEYLSEKEHIFEPIEKASILYDTLEAFKNGMEKLRITSTLVTLKYIDKTIEHERVHAEIAQRVAQKMGLTIMIRYRLCLLNHHSGRIGMGPSVEIFYWGPVELYTEFWDALICEHPNPSEGDKQFI